MSLDDVNLPTRQVAVAGSRDVAAGAFGRDHDDLVVTSYADFDREVDLADVATLDLVADAQMGSALAAGAAAVHRGQQLRLRLAVREGDDPSAVARHLERCSLQVVDVDGAHGTVALVLAGTGAPTPDPRELLLRALSTAHHDTPEPPRPSEPAQRPADPAADLEDLRPGPRPQPQLVGFLGRVQGWRAGGRVRLVVAATLLVGTVVLLVLGAISSAALLAIAVPLLAALALVGTATTCYLLLVLSRQVNAQTGRLERVVLGNREVLRRRSRAIEARVTELERQVALPHVMEYLEAVAAHSAETAASVRDLADAAEQRDRS